MGEGDPEPLTETPSVDSHFAWDPTHILLFEISFGLYRAHGKASSSLESFSNSSVSIHFRLSEYTVVARKHDRFQCLFESGDHRRKSTLQVGNPLPPLRIFAA